MNIITNTFSRQDLARFSSQLKTFEGLRLTAYRCPAGALTIGYGHNVDAHPIPGVARTGDRITLDKADEIFLNDRDKTITAVRCALPWVDALCAPRQAVLYDMAFNMGLGRWGESGLLSFRNTLSHMERGDYAAAARGMRNSKWAQQVKSRAKHLAQQMATGVWQAAKVTPPVSDSGPSPTPPAAAAAPQKHTILEALPALGRLIELATQNGKTGGKRLTSWRYILVWIIVAAFAWELIIRPFLVWQIPSLTMGPSILDDLLRILPVLSGLDM